ncbi:MAG: hypothetical protein KJO95_05105 [Gammaproteobacteria bacterium]|nr:hypothetical protein [Gammaproteobacteria bacterium]
MKASTAMTNAMLAKYVDIRPGSRIEIAAYVHANLMTSTLPGVMGVLALTPADSA